MYLKLRKSIMCYIIIFSVIAWLTPLNDYSIVFGDTPSSNASIANITVNGVSVDPVVLGLTEVAYNLRATTHGIPDVVVTPADAGATVSIQPPQTIPGNLIIEVTAADGITKRSLNIRFTRELSNDSYLANVSLDDQSLSGFDKNINSYNYEISKDMNDFPVITALASDPNAKVEVTKANRNNMAATIKVTATNTSQVRTYTINFTRAANNNADLNTIKINGADINSFDKNVTDYDFELQPSLTSMPNIGFELNDKFASAVVNNAAQIPGTATITVTGSDNVTTKQYSIHLTRQNHDASLAKILVDENALANFSAQTLDYTVIVPYKNNRVPYVRPIVNDPLAKVTMQGAANLEGTTSINVAATDGVTNSTYRINFRKITNSNANLKSLSINESAINGFNSSTLEYNSELSSQTINPPTISAQAEDEDAVVSIINATNIPGRALINVTSSDGSKKQYIVNFTKAVKIAPAIAVTTTTSGSNSVSTSIQSTISQNGQAAIDKIENLTKNIDNLTPEQKEKVKDDVVSVAQKAIEKTGEITLDSKSISVEGNVATVEVKSDDIISKIEEKASEIEKISQKVDEVAKDKGEEIKKTIVINIEKPSGDINNIKVDFLGKVINEIKKKDIDNLVFDMKYVSFDVTPETFGKLQDNQNISLSEKANSNETISNLPEQVEKTAIPVIEIKASEGEKEISNFKKPMEVYIDVSTLDTSKMTQDEIDDLTVYIYNEENKSWEPVGGTFDPKTNSIKVFRIHFSKYTVMKSNKSFSDIKGHEDEKADKFITKKRCIRRYSEVFS